MNLKWNQDYHVILLPSSPDFSQLHPVGSCLGGRKLLLICHIYQGKRPPASWKLFPYSSPQIHGINNLHLSKSFPCGSAGKESTCNAGDLGSIPGLGRSPGEGNGYPLQYSDLENSMGCIVHRVAKSWTWLSIFHSLKSFLTELTPFPLLLTVKGKAPPALLLPQGLRRSKYLVSCVPWRYKCIGQLGNTL